MTGRRATGVIMLLVIAVAVWLVNSAHGDRVAGRPMAEWPQPPAVGSCVTITDDGPQVVLCSGPHDGEVTRTFGALDPMVTSMTQDPVYDACGDAARRYVGDSVDAASGRAALDAQPGWRTPPLSYGGQPVYAPPGERVGRYGWVACVITPQEPGQYVGSVEGALTSQPQAGGTSADALTAETMPPAFRSCFDLPRRPASCVGPHDAETLASYVGERDPLVAGAGSGSSAPAEVETRRSALRQQRQRQCQELAAHLIGAGDPTFGGTVTIRADDGLTAVVAQGEEGQGGGGVRVAGGSGDVDCTARAARGEQLTDSLIGWGDRPPPIARS